MSKRSVFSTRQHICGARYRYMLSFCPSVCLSVTQVDQSKMVEVSIMQLSLQSSQIPLVFAVYV